VRNPIIFAVMALVSCGCEPGTPATSASAGAALTNFPSQIDPGCGNGRARIYDECGSQVRLYEEALDDARRTGKTLLVSYGAEWCIWCHVFDAHLRGATGSFQYPVEGDEVTLTERAGSGVLADARSLNEFAADAFVLVHIEADHAPDGRRVLETTGAAASFDGGYPFIFTVTPAGRVGAVFNHDAAEVRRDTLIDWYRGYDRYALKAELTRMRDAAREDAAVAER
jgi:hypothetical protein